MKRLKEYVEINSAFIAFVFLEYSGDDSSGKTRLVVDKTISLGRQSPRNYFFRRWIAGFCLLSAANDDHVRRQRDVDGCCKAVNTIRIHWKPPAGIKQIAGVIPNGCQLQTLNRTVVH